MSRECVGESRGFDANKAGRQHSVLPTPWSLIVVPLGFMVAASVNDHKEYAPDGPAGGAIWPRQPLHRPFCEPSPVVLKPRLRR
jgi:hypothetical protein